MEYDGCEAVLVPGPVCVLYPNRRLWLWVEDHPGAQVEIRAGGERIDAKARPVRGGQRLSFKVPAETERLDLLVTLPDGRAVWSLALDSGARPRQGTHDLLREVRETPWLQLIDDRRFAEVRERLDRVRLPEKEPAESRYLTRYYRGVLAEREGDYRSALAATQGAVEIAERCLWGKRRAWLTRQQLGLLLLEVGRSREAAELFARLGKTPQYVNACEEADLLNNRAWAALLAREAGASLGDPTPLLEKALAIYKTCAGFTPELRLNVLINLALAHLQEGRLAQARDLIAETRGLERHAALFYRLWWLDLEARTTLAEGQPLEALRLFTHLGDLSRAAGSADDSWRAAFGQARAHEALGNRAAALAALRQAEALLDEQSLQVPLQEGRETFMAMRQSVVGLHIDLLLEQGRTAEALAVARHARSRLLRQLERSDRLANLTPGHREEWERLLAEYQEKRQALEERARNDWMLPADQLQREQAARQAEAATAQQLLDRAFLLLGDSGGRPDEAPPLRPGELILAYQPLHPAHRGWVGFAAGAGILQAYRFDLPPDVLARPEELSQRLLLPFRAAIERSQRLRILPSGVLEGVDFHALPFAGDVLVAGRPVVYGLDLPVPSSPSRAPGRRALLVADPRGDLPGARAEARAVRQALESRAQPWTLTELRAAAASAGTLRGRLAAADLLHYAGHGSFSGFGGWESSLLLADETRLTLGDLLALERVPAWVVLSACDGGRSSAEASVEGLGLAHAFLLAGSRAVVASTRPADDRTTPGLFAELYRQWDQEPDLAVALQRAQLAWRRHGSGADWSAFRVFEP